jgi:cell division septum initiation protein DivIVA
MRKEVEALVNGNEDLDVEIKDLKYKVTSLTNQKKQCLEPPKPQP